MITPVPRELEPEPPWLLLPLLRTDVVRIIRARDRANWRDVLAEVCFAFAAALFVDALAPPVVLLNHEIKFVVFQLILFHFDILIRIT